MKKFKKIITMGLVTVMALSAMSIGAFATDDDSEVVYSYNDYGTTVNVTQSDLDAEHWNRDALGETAPLVYKDFPMSIDSFVNDYAELSLDIVYMKKIEDMEATYLTIKQMDGDEFVYNGPIEQTSFYSDVLNIGDAYEMTLTETVDGETREYTRTIYTEENTADMPEYVTNPEADDTTEILIADIANLQNGESINEDGQLVVNTSIATYDKVAANEFDEYCANLPLNHTYRIFATEDGRQYGGFYSKGHHGNEIYDFSINVMSSSDSLIQSHSLPSGITADTVKSNAEDIRIGDNCFRLKETTNNAKYAAFCVNLPDSYVGSSKDAQFNITVTGTSKVTMKVWSETSKSEGPKTFGTYTSTNTSNSKTVSVHTSNYNDGDYIAFYVMIYFPSAVDGYGMINVTAVSGYTDDVTGSVYDAYNGANSHVELQNTQYNLTDSWDIDAFHINYTGESQMYKIELKNRSLTDQSNLENGTNVKGSPAKYMTLWYITERSNVLEWGSNNIYTVPKNVDMVVYCDPAYNDEYVITVQNVSTGLTTKNYYQLSYTQI